MDSSAFYADYWICLAVVSRAAYVRLIYERGDALH